MYKLRQQHPLIGVRVYLDDNNEAFFTTEGVPDNQLRVIKRNSVDEWSRELSSEYNNRFKLGKGPLARFVLVTSKDVSEIIVICHHVICDGTSLTILARDILLYLSNPDREAQIMPEAPLANLDNFSEEIKVNKAIRFAIKKMNKRWEKNKVIFDEEDEDNLFRAFRNSYNNKNIIVELSETQTINLIKNCKENGVTVNSALNTAFLAARTSVLGPFKGGKQNLMVPVNTRDKYKKPVGENVGVFVSGFQFKSPYKPEKTFWENAKIFDIGVKKNLDIKNIFKFAALTEIIDPTIVDARNFSFFGKEVTPNYSRYEKIHKFSTDDKNIVNKRAKKQLPEMPGLAITNLGQLDFPKKYGPLELDRFIFLTSGTPLIELVVPVVTVAGKMTCTINYLEEITSTEIMEKIRDKVLENLNL